MTTSSDSDEPHGIAAGDDPGTGSFDVESHVNAVNSFATEGLWLLGRYVAECLVVEGELHGHTRDAIIEQVSSHPRARHPASFLKQCLLLYSLYPDVPTRPLPEVFYLDLATRVFDEASRGEYEQRAIDGRWNITQLRKAIRDEVLVRKEAARSELGFDLKVTNWWYFNSADPRFGKSQFRGRIAGQIIANSLYYYAPEEGRVIDPFAGSATLADVIDQLPCFRGLKYRLYDIRPADPRVTRNDVVLGFPEESATADYVFLDPPYGSIPRGFYTDEPQDLSQMPDELFVATMKGVVRECRRVLVEGGHVSVVLEQHLTASAFSDLPTTIAQEFLRAGFVQVGKVYLPNQTMRRGDMMPYLITTAKRRRFMLSDCRELLTFRK